MAELTITKNILSNESFFVIVDKTKFIMRKQKESQTCCVWCRTDGMRANKVYIDVGTFDLESVVDFVNCSKKA